MTFINKSLTINKFKNLHFIKTAAFSISINYPNNIYSNEHILFQDSLKKLIDKDINPYIDEWESKKIFPAKHLFKILGKAGFLGIDKPVEFGGLGLDFTYYMAIAEQLGAISCGSIPMAIGVQSNMSISCLMKNGSDKLKKEFLTPTIAGDVVACLGVSELEAGSDVAAIKTTGKASGDDLIINGGKMWITNGVQADWMCLLANTESDRKPHLNKSLIVLPMKLPGVTVARSIDKMGMHCSDTAQIFFDNVRVPKSHIIGEPGKGFTYQMVQFQEERLYGVAVSLLSLEEVIKKTLEYANQRMIYGRPLIDNQIVIFTMGELLTELECVRALFYRALRNYTVDKLDVTLFTSMLKLKIGRLSREITDKCLQFWGGMGYVSESFVNRAFRDFRLISIGAGADEVMLGIISKYLKSSLK